MDFGTFFPEGSPLAIVKYWSNYADSAEIPVSGENGWEILRSGTEEREIFACSHPGLGFQFELHCSALPDGFELFLPRESLKETYNRWHSIRLLPDLCRTHEGAEGYYLLPQQSGVLSRFRNKRSAVYEIGIYGNGLSECNMPVYGMSDGKTLLGVILREGYCDALLHLETARGAHRTYRLAPVFQLRYELSVRRQNMPMVNDEIRIRVRRRPLNGRSGAAVLAELYREERIAAGEIVPLKTRAAENPVLAEALRSPEIRIRMGSKWPFPTEVMEQTPENEPSVHAFCTFRQVESIVDECRKQGLEHANFCLVGWAAKGHDGRYPQILPVEESFGGETALRSLIRHTRSAGYTISAHDNHYDAYSISEDPFDTLLIRTQEGFPIKDGVWSGGQAWLLCPEAMRKTYSLRNLQAIHDLGFRGVHFTDCLTSTGLRVCWDPVHPNTKTGMARWRTDILRTAKEIFGGVQCEGPFDFAAGVLDRVLYIDTADDGSGLSARDYVDEIVPLYEMVYHGILLYNLTGESINALPGSDQYLRNLSFGGMPFFYFYRHFATKNYLPGTNTPVPGRFETADFTLDNLEAEIAAVKQAADDYIGTLGDLQLCRITEFTRLSETLTRTDYSGGESVYVNFGTSPVEIDGVTVPPRSFARKG